jgi:hypothetical protein
MGGDVADDKATTPPPFATEPGNRLAIMRSVIPSCQLNRYEQQVYAEQQADRLLQLTGVTAPPVPEHVIIDTPRLQVEPTPGLPVHGATWWRADHWVISIAAEDPLGTRRHSLTHEFKHVLDHPLYQHLYRDSDGHIDEEWAEAAADYFAMSLLTPRRWVLQAWDEGIHSIAGLSARFGVDEHTMTCRAWLLGLTGTGPTCGRRLPTRYANPANLEGGHL